LAKKNLGEPKNRETIAAGDVPTVFREKKRQAVLKKSKKKEPGPTPVAVKPSNRSGKIRLHKTSMGETAMGNRDQSTTYSGELRKAEKFEKKKRRDT